MCAAGKDEMVDHSGVLAKGPAFGKRHVQIIFMFFLTAITYTMRVNLSVAIVAMTDNTTSSNPDIPNIRTPWKAILTSVPVWAYVIACYGGEWAFSTLLTEMPTYINKIMKFDIQSNSWLSAAPYACVIIVTLVCGILSDYLINSGYISLPNERKLFSTIGLSGSGITLIVLAYIPETATGLMITLLIATIGLGGVSTSGFFLNNIDLSPTFAGTDKLQWRIVFLVAAGISIASNIFYLAFTTTEVQWWNSPNNQKKTEEKLVNAIVEHQKKLSIT
ncbi:hypothetical protein NQ318_004200 [Aromia moschata]|uniref:Inorganic phosphate cotransporter n=1 Tax=Aromia moschata TaxID=1265417 RepID=A0AAV8Y5R6_9CUCU|nr:hypothetical protein NQ318_004200 [Aromia moschata]